MKKGQGEGNPVSTNKKSLIAGLRLIIVVVFIVFGSAFVITALSILSKSRRDYEIRESETLITSVGGSITANVDNYKALTRIILMDDSVLRYLKMQTPGLGDANDANYGIRRVLNVSTDVDSVILIRNDGHHLNTGHGEYSIDINKIQSWAWKHTILEGNGRAFVAMNGDDTVERDGVYPLVTVIRPTIDLYSLKQTGIMMMNIMAESMLDRILPANDSKICITSNDGTYLAGNPELAGYFTEEFLSNKIIHKNMDRKTGMHMISGRLLNELPFVVLCSSNAGTEKISADTVVVLVLIFMAFLISIIIAGSFVRKNIIKPITNMTSAMQKTEKSGWLESLDVDIPDNEIGMLRDNFNTVIGQQNELFNSLIEKEKSIQRAEMSVLHEQIKPHFLYNALGTINSMALEDGAEDVSAAIETLGNFYRNFLSKGSKEITLKKEICIVQDYLSLQKLRYGDVIADEYDIAPDTEDFRIPKLILQPLVENSIYHGIRLTGEQGTIAISSFMDDGKLHIIVRDNGVGMSQEQIDAALSKIDAGVDETERKSFGLRGTIERIRYYCGSRDVIQIRSEEGEYTEIELTISPSRSEEEENVQGDDN